MVRAHALKSKQQIKININNIIIIFTKEEKEKKKKHTQITNKKTVPEPINEPKFRFEIKPPMAIFL